MIYLDNAATTKIDSEVLDAMMPYLTEEYGNPGGIYALGRRAADAVAKAREQVAEFIGASPEQIIFTSGGSEANNLALLSVENELIVHGRTEIVTDGTEHDSVLNTVKRMADRGFIPKYLPVNKIGAIEIPSFCDIITQNTGLVSVMYMNNETGTENPVPEIGQVCADHGILFHTDCVQAAGCCDLDVNKLHCDFLSISSHKIHGPKGMGALFVKNRRICMPLISGGSAQEFGLRGGTENVAGIVGFGKACELMRQNLHEVDVHTSMLKQLFYNRLVEKLSEKNGLNRIIHVNGDLVIKHGKTLNLRFDGVDGLTLLVMLDSGGICVSAGSACTSHEEKPSHVLTAMGIEPDDARNSIRVSFSKMNKQDEVLQAADMIATCVAVLNQK